MKPLLMIFCVFVCSPLLAINEHSDSFEITDNATVLISDAKQYLDENCDVSFVNRMSVLHADFTYSSHTYLIAGDHIFWGESKRDLGMEYWSWGCESVAEKLFEQARYHAVISAHEELLNSVANLPADLLPPGQINSELCRRTTRTDCPL
ncbi:hypothetical protein QTP81_00720 [Alteromonas sp. ASW11-36]|uniref:Uncharacterized protein n=1 Tax=Alteromonas arenosi TaxID=3055817 RepID=A0ABT7SUD0_9ALTE|nr:hypothetical protein [Alteromonas sp. ASW11-36]MDM7859124.1 hypothetical protein [Alteromonas sp. ASW11-36]